MWPSWSWIFDEELPLIPCLPGEFNQVILNIIINASHAIADVVGDGSKWERENRREHPSRR